MGWLGRLQGNVIGLDTAPLIYFMERNPRYIETMRFFFLALNRGDFTVVTSVITLSEVLVHPLRHNDTALAQQYRDILFNSEGITTLGVSPRIAEIAAQLRASYNLRTPDAIQMATAISREAAFFLTNDERLPPLVQLEILVLEALGN